MTSVLFAYLYWCAFILIVVLVALFVFAVGWWLTDWWEDRDALKRIRWHLEREGLWRCAVDPCGPMDDLESWFSLPAVDHEPWGLA